MHRQDVSDGGGGRHLTTAEVLDRTMDQCMQRGLFDSASWLGQLALDATDSVLQETIPASSPVCVAVQDLPLTGRAHRYHVLALALVQKGEYLRCHHLLNTALKEYTATATSTTAAAREEGEAHAKGEKPLPRGGSRSTSQQSQQQSPSSPSAPPQLQFLCLYSLYMAGECIKSTSSNLRKSSNPNLLMLRGLLLTALEQQRRSSSTPSAASLPMRPSLKADSRSSPSMATGVVGGAAAYGDPFLCWLHGVVLRELGMKQESATYFLAALCSHPMLWCAWEDLCTLVSRENQIEEIEAMIASLEPRFMPEMFLASVKAALNVAPLSFEPASVASAATAANAPAVSGKRSTSPHHSSSSPQPKMEHDYQRQHPQQRRGDGAASPRLVNSWEVLLEQFPNNPFLLSSLAGYYYNVKKDLEKAQTLYKRLHDTDPYRLESMDDYSIVLFLRGDRIGLSSLAQQVYHIDPFRAESNYIVGNYYVLMGAHDRGVLHFRRAVAADPTFLAAWTLLGHAYLETKNSAAAVEAYRTAVDLDQRDYRGWYNLGQIYELLQFYHHALYYYWHTTTLRPTDPRMWSAVANCLDREGRTSEAMLCLERAETYESPASDFYPPLVRRLGMHYLDTRQVGRAIAYLEKLATAEARKREDVLLAVPQIVPYYLQQARQLLDVPARSPSYEPPPPFATASASAGRQSLPSAAGSGGWSSLADQWRTADAALRRNIDARWEQAAVCLATSESHLENLAVALGLPNAAAAAAAAAAGDSTVMGKGTDYGAAGGGVAGSVMDEGRSRHISHLARYYRELNAVRHYLSSQQQQVEATVRARESDEVHRE
ncbi:hypothetical protein DQ04_01661110 [Trypanosoma grayi]|uniref:hypothetical protein n=1 Tax=Trypanosoma grayi TaxID=71804 RepID=UPI0004F455A5|nr:hypothetical protein DQ04_01661110 [Trypanosoma grayi]KEG12507.1 hypothetical protein DQ04_01661110 [Trypanosoma grayi]